MLSLAMVEAAVHSAERGTRVFVDTMLEDSYRDAVAAEKRPGVLAALTGWGSAKAGLAAVLEDAE